MKRGLVAARLVAVGLVLGLCGGAQAQPVSGGLLGRGTSYSSFVAPTGCVSTSVPFFGADVKLGCDGGITYATATKTLTVGALAANNVTATALATPGSITVANQGTPGSTTVTYKLVALLPDGTTTEAGAASSTTTSTATLSASNFNRLTWSAVTGASSYRVYRTVSPTTPNTTGIIYSGTALTVDDTGLAGGGETAPTVNGTGVGRANRVLVGDGTAAAPGMAFASGDGLYDATGAIRWAIAGTARGFLSATQVGVPQDAGSFTLGAALDLTISRAAAATLQLGAANSATPVAQILQAQGATGTDVAGANLTIRSGAGTGAATGSSLIFQTPTATTTGTTEQTQATRLSMTAAQSRFNNHVVPETTDGWALGSVTGPLLWQNLYLSRATLGSKSKALTDGSPVTFATFTIANAAMYSGEIIYNVKAVKGTDLQVLANKARFTAARVGTNYYVSVAAIGSDVVSVSTGTLSCPISISGTGGVISLAATADTSFASPDSLVGQFRFDSPDAGLTLTFP